MRRSAVPTVPCCHGVLPKIPNERLLAQPCTLVSPRDTLFNGLSRRRSIPSIPACIGIWRPRTSAQTRPGATITTQISASAFILGRLSHEPSCTYAKSEQRQTFACEYSEYIGHTGERPGGFSRKFNVHIFDVGRDWQCQYWTISPGCGFIESRPLNFSG